MALYPIKYPSKSDKCLYSVYDDCLELRAGSTNLFVSEGARDRACIQFIELPVENDSITFFSSTPSDTLKFQFVPVQDIGTLKCRNTARICIALKETLPEQIEALVSALQRYAIFEAYTITVNYEDFSICIEAKSVGVKESPIGVLRSEDIESAVITTNPGNAGIKENLNQIGKDYEVLPDYKAVFHIYERSITEQNGEKIVKYALLWKSPPRPYFIKAQPPAHYFPYTIGEYLKQHAWSRFVWDDDKNTLPGLHNLSSMVKEIAISYSEHWTVLANNSREEDRTVSSNIKPLVPYFTVIHAKTPPWSDGLGQFCNCEANQPELDTRFFAYYPDGLEIGGGGILPLSVFVCVPENGLSAGKATGKWCVDVYLKNGTSHQGIELADIEIYQSTVLQYNLDLSNDPALLAVIGDLDHNCKSPIENIVAYVKIDTEGNPLDFSYTCAYIPEADKYHLQLQSNGLFYGIEEGNFVWERISDGNEIWEKIGTNSSVNLVYQSGNISNMVIRLTAIINDCELFAQRTISIGGCVVKAGIELKVEEVEELSLCEEFEVKAVFVAQNVYANTGTYSNFFSIEEIINEINNKSGVDPSSLFIEQSVGDNISNNHLLVSSHDITEPTLYNLKISYKYNGHLIVRSLQTTLFAPTQNVNGYPIEVTCEDATKGTGVKITALDRSFGGTLIDSKKYYYAYAFEWADFETQVLPILTEYDASVDDLYYAHNSEFATKGYCLWVVQIVEGCGEESKWAYQRVCLDCNSGNNNLFAFFDRCKIQLDIDYSDHTCTNAAYIKTSRLLGSATQYTIKLINEAGFEVMSVSSTPEVNSPMLDTGRLDLPTGEYKVKVETIDDCRLEYSVSIRKRCGCAAPNVLKAIPTKSGGFFVQWSTVDTADHYILRYKREDAGETEEWITYQNNQFFGDTQGNPDGKNVNVEGDRFKECALYVFDIKAVCGGVVSETATESNVAESQCCNPCEDDTNTLLPPSPCELYVLDSVGVCVDDCSLFVSSSVGVCEECAGVSVTDSLGVCEEETEQGAADINKTANCGETITINF